MVLVKNKKLVMIVFVITFSTVLGNLQSFFNSIGDSVTSAWNYVVEAVKAPRNKYERFDERYDDHEEKRKARMKFELPVSLRDPLKMVAMRPDPISDDYLKSEEKIKVTRRKEVYVSPGPFATAVTSKSSNLVGTTLASLEERHRVKIPLLATSRIYLNYNEDLPNKIIPEFTQETDQNSGTRAPIKELNDLRTHPATKYANPTEIGLQGSAISKGSRYTDKIREFFKASFHVNTDMYLTSPATKQRKEQVKSQSTQKGYYLF